VGVLFRYGGGISIHTSMGNVFNNHSLHKNGGRCNKGQKMNERLKELATQAGMIAGEHDNNNFKKTLSKTELKFAELVIKETMQVVAKNVAWNGYLNAAEAVIEHFKDEE
jgi:hypothetical protein